MNMLVTAAGVAASSVALPSPSLAGGRSLVAPADQAVAASNSGGMQVATPEVNTEARTLPETSFPEYPPEIFGQLPDGFVLEEQPIELPCFWHRKAITVIDEFLDGATDGEAIDEKLAAYRGSKNRIIFDAILPAPASIVRQVAAKLRAAVDEMEHLKTDASPAVIEEVLNGDNLMQMSAELSRATAPIAPKKHVGALQRGRKLTRAGLLTRYQSFLVQELETVSWNLYGERDFAKHCIMYDDAVGARCNSPGGPFFDEKELPNRARTVLESLNVDTESSTDRA